jgi:putative DNA primase/helicase
MTVQAILRNILRFVEFYKCFSGLSEGRSIVFDADELHQARAAPVLDIAEKYGAKLKKEGRELTGACPRCGGDDRFAVWPTKNWWHCRGCKKGGDAIALERHLGDLTFIEAVRALIGEDAGTAQRRPPSPEEVAARKAREAERERTEAAEQARNTASAARILAQTQPLIGAPGETYLRDVRGIDPTHPALERLLEDVEALGWCERVYFKQPDPDKPGYELNGQHLGAIIGILTDHVTGEPTGGITRTYIHQGRKVCRAKSLGTVGRLGVIRLTPDDEVESGLHLCEGIESALSAMMFRFIPMWAAGSTSTLAAFPVLNGVEHLTIVADNDRKTPDEVAAGEEAAREVYRRWKAAGREAEIVMSKTPGEDANDVLRRRMRA